MCLGDSLCYLENSAIANFLDREDIRELLGAESPGNFTSCSREVGRHFNAHMDKWAVPSQYYVAGLLERGIRMLIYAGTYDWQCNWVANKLWVDKLEWTGKDAYDAAEWRDWLVDGHKAGETKTAGLLTFATVREAGHMGGHPAVWSFTIVMLTVVIRQFLTISPRNHLPWSRDGWLVRICERRNTQDPSSVSEGMYWM